MVMTAGKVLVVEDEPDLREILIYNLKRGGFDVCASGDGWESLLIAHLQGLQLFVAHPQLCCKSCATQSFVFSSLTQACSKHLEWRLLISHIA